MSTLRFAALTALALAAGAGAGRPADLAAVDRSVAKEPRYRSDPHYCLLVFGPKAEKRVWLVQDGDRLYVDRDGDGDLTGPGERVGAAEAEVRFVVRDGPAGKEKVRVESYAFDIGELTGPGGTPKHAGVTLRVKRLGREPPECHLSARVGGECTRYGIGRDGAGFRPSDRPGRAPVVHVDGPLSVVPRSGPAVPAGGGEFEFYADVGTPGPEGTVSAIAYQAAPRDRHPVLEIEFPAAGGGTVTVKAALSERC